MTTNTMVALQTITVSSTTATITFNSIPQTYTDLVLVCTPVVSTGSYPWLRFNSDSTNTYSDTALNGNGSTASSGRRTANSRGYIAEWVTHSTSALSNIITHIQNYSNSTTYKTYLARGNSTQSGTYTGTEAIVGLWQSTSAITSITIGTASSGTDYNLSAGFTATLYGI